MYKLFFGLLKEPFSKNKNNDSLFKSGNFLELENRLDYMKQHKGIFLISGEPGTGKSTACRYFMDSLKSDFYKTCYINHSTVNSIQFYRQINEALGGEWSSRKDQLFKSIQSLIQHETVNNKKCPVIILDECQYLKNQNIFELQLLLNFNMDSLDPLIVILIAQPHFLHRLKRPVFKSFYHRIHLLYEYFPLSESETKNYILHELKSAGCSSPVFTDGALSSIYRITGGNMREIGKLCIKSLMVSATKKIHSIDQKLIYEAQNEL